MNVTQPQADDQDRLYSKVAWRLMPILFAGYVIAYIDRVNIGFAKLQMLSDLKFSDAVYGLGAGIFFVGFTLLEVPSNLILFRVGAKAWLARIMVTWGVLSVLMMFVQTPAVFYTLRFLLGAAEAGFLPGVIYYLTLWFPPERRGRMFAIFTSGSAVGGVIVGPLSGLIMTYLHEAAGLRGWQWLFLLQGSAAVVLSVLLFVLLSNDPASAPWLNAKERAQLPGKPIAGADEHRAPGGLSAALADSRIWLLGLILGLVNLGIYLGVFWLPTIIRDAGITDFRTIGWVSSISYLGAALAMLGLGKSSDRFNDRRWHVAVTVTCAAVALAASALAANAPMVAVCGIVLSTALFIGVTPLLWAHASTFLEGETAAAGFALINVCAGIAAFLAPYATGLAEEHLGSIALVSFVISACAILAAAILVGARSLMPVTSGSVATG